MLDKRLDERIKNFQKPLNNLLNAREDFAVTLRKEKLFDQLMEKRLNKFINEKNKNKNFGIKYDDLNISSEDMQIYNKLDKSVRLDYIVNAIKSNQNNQKIKNFAIYNLKFILLQDLKQNKEEKEKILEKDLVDILTVEMGRTLFTEVQYDISLILTSITFEASEIVDKIIDKESLIMLFDFLIQNLNIEIIDNILITLGNITIEDKNFVIRNVEYIRYIKDFLKLIKTKNEKQPYETTLMTVLWNLCLICKNLSQNESEMFLDFIPLLIEYLNIVDLEIFSLLLKNKEVLKCTLEILSDLSNNDTICLLLINNKIMNCICEILYHHLHTQNELSINYSEISDSFKILGNLFTLDDSFLINNKLLDDNILTLTQNILFKYENYNSDTKKIVVDVIWFISNLAAGPQYQSEKLFFITNIPKIVVRMGKHDEKIFSQISFFFENLLVKGSDSVIIEILKLNVIKILCDYLKSTNNKQIILTCLNTLNNIIKFGEKISDNMFLIKKELIKVGLNARLEQLTLHNNNEVSDSACYTLENLENYTKSNLI